MRENPFGDMEDLRKAIADEDRSRPRDLNETPLEAQTGLVMPPEVFPIDHVDAESLYRNLQRRFGVTVDFARYKTIISNNQIDPVALIDHLVKNDENIYLQNGLLQFQDDPRTTPIKYIAITKEQINVTVIGSTSESDWVAQKILEEVWTAAGAQRQWDQLKGGVQLKSNTTLSLIEIKHNLIDLFSDAFRSFVAADIVDQAGFGKTMGIQPIDKDTNPDKTYTRVVPHVTSTEMSISLFNDVTGRFESCSFKMSVRARSDYGLGRINVMSELDSRSHTELVSRLFAKLIS